MKKLFYRVGKTIGVILLLPLFLLAMVQAPPVKALLASELSRVLSRSDDGKVTIRGLSGWIPFEMQVDRLELGDAEGVWLHADGVHVRWNVRDLRDRRIQLDRLRAERIEVLRRPLFPPRPQEQGSGTPPPKESRFQPLEIRVGLFAIEELLFNESVAGVPLTYALHSSGIQWRPSGVFSGDLVVSGDATGQLDFSEKHLSLPCFSVRFGEYESAGNLAVTRRAEALDARVDATLVKGGTSLGSIQIESSISIDEAPWVMTFQTLDVHGPDPFGLSLQGTVSPDRLNLNGTLAEFDVKDLPVSRLTNFTGRASGTLAVMGTLADPEVQAELDVLGFTTGQKTLDDVPLLSFHVSSQLSDGKFSGASHITNSLPGFIEVAMEMPCAFSLSPFQFKAEPSQIRATLGAELDTAVLNHFPRFSGQRFTGLLKADGVYDQKVSGTIQMENGSYEHYRWGLFVQDVTLDLAATDAGFHVKTATATDGGDGLLTMTGGSVSNQLALTLDFDRARIIRRDDVETTFSGALDIHGPMTRPEVAGTLVLDRTDIYPNNRAPRLPPLLVDYDASTEVIPPSETIEKGSKFPFGLDVRLDLNDHLFVNASIIDAVWGGEILLTDRPDGLSYEGWVEPRRGSITFIGKRFHLIEGQIDLDGSIPAKPSMNQLTAEYRRSDFTARLILNGRFDNPDIRLESSPPMPEDEVLSRVLFGQGLSSMTPFEIYQVAAAAKQLAGGLEGPGFMHRAQQTIGVDTLDWREGEDGASTVAAGKYLTSDLYVEMNRSLDDKGGTGVTAEYDVTKHISIESSTGTQMRPGIGVNWKIDY